MYKRQADGVGVCALQGRACVIAVVVKVRRPVFRLGLVQPEASDAILVVVLLALLQQEAYQSMQKAQQDAMAPIYQKLDDAIQAVGKAERCV